MYALISPRVNKNPYHLINGSSLGTEKFQEGNYFWNSYLLLRQDDRIDAYDASFAPPLSGARQTKFELEDYEAGEEQLQREDEEDKEREHVAPRMA